MTEEKKSEKSKARPKEKKLRMFGSDAERRGELGQDARDLAALAYRPPEKK